jgi:hypothetical protein
LQLRDFRTLPIDVFLAPVDVLVRANELLRVEFETIHFDNEQVHKNGVLCAIGFRQ